MDQSHQPAPQPPRPHRPSLHADLTAVIDAAGGESPAARSEVAAATAAVVVSAGRRDGGDRFVELADRVGIDTLAELWKNADPVSLPGALWALYVLRQWCHSNGEEVRMLWRAGAGLAPADAVVAGLAEAADVDSVHQMADAVLGGVYGGDLDVALERAAALFRVVAVGRRELAGPDERGDAERALADRNERVAADLTTAARTWRAGTLH
ncbi:hypothetical protein [Jatrophihabitans sp.]|uniref:hypothetical protein n=1 Tax=Jatrophihabitans sp. TaxID=1932789 RepID=UPI0030C68BDB